MLQEALHRPGISYSLHAGKASSILTEVKIPETTWFGFESDSNKTGT